MSEPTYDSTETYDREDSRPGDQPKWRRDLEARAKAGDEAKAELDKAQRELAFARAGVPLDHKNSPIFMRGYDGELTAEAIKAAAIDFGLLAGDTSTDPAKADEVKAVGTMSDAATGTPPTGGEVEELRRIWREEGEMAALKYMDSLGIGTTLIQ